MAKAKSSKRPTSTWLEIQCRVNQLLLIAPAEQALACAPLVLTDLEGVEALSPTALAPFAGTTLEAKTRGIFGGGAILPAAGTYRVETGAGKDGRWLRFVRAQTTKPNRPT